jgi:hypothetical protein
MRRRAESGDCIGAPPRSQSRDWRIPRLAPAAEAALFSRRDEHVGACARTANSTEPTVGVGLLLIPSSRVIGVSTALIR